MSKPILPPDLGLSMPFSEEVIRLNQREDKLDRSDSLNFGELAESPKKKSSTKKFKKWTTA